MASTGIGKEDIRFNEIQPPTKPDLEEQQHKIRGDRSAAILDGERVQVSEKDVSISPSVEAGERR